MNVFIDILLPFISILYLLLSACWDDPNMTSSIAPPIKKEEEDNSEDNVSIVDSMMVNTTNRHITTHTRMDMLINNSKELILQQEVFKNNNNNNNNMLSNLNTRSILLNYCLNVKKHDNTNYSLAYALSVLSVSTLSTSNIKLPSRCIHILTNIFRVSSTFPMELLANLIQQENYYAVPPKQKKIKFNNSHMKSTNDIQYERMSVSVLEKLNRLQAELWLSFPLQQQHIITLSPTLSTSTATSSSHDDNSSSCFNSSKRNSITSLTSQEEEGDLVNSTYHYKLFDFNTMMMDKEEGLLSPFDATIDDVIKFNIDFYHTKSNIHNLLNGEMTIHQDRFKQVTNGIQSIIKNCDQLESVLHTFQSKFIFSQMHQLITDCFKENDEFITHMIVNKKVDITRTDLDTIEDWIATIKFLIEGVLSNMIPQDDIICSAMVTELVLKNTELTSQYNEINTIWNSLDTIKYYIKDGMELMSSLQLSEEYLSTHYSYAMNTIKYIQYTLHDIIQKDLQEILTQQIQKQEQSPHKHLLFHEKMIDSMVEYALFQLQQFKNEFMTKSLVLQKYKKKQELKEDIETAKSWCTLFRKRLIQVTVDENPKWSIYDKECNSAKLVDLHEQYDTFILTLYNAICDYFPRYSNKDIIHIFLKNDKQHLLEEYGWFEELQTLLDGVNEMIQLTTKLQQQQHNIIQFVQLVSKVTDVLEELVTQLYSEPTKAIGKVATVKEELGDWIDLGIGTFREKFNRIQWPTQQELDILGREYYKYNQSLYLDLSEMKVDFITVCEQTNRKLEQYM